MIEKDVVKDVVKDVGKELPDFIKDFIKENRAQVSERQEKIPCATGTGD